MGGKGERERVSGRAWREMTGIEEGCSEGQGQQEQDGFRGGMVKVEFLRMANTGDRSR